MDNQNRNTPPPGHVAIIMDGNGRWASKRNLDRIHGHIQGVESIRKVIRAAVHNDVKYLTLYAFSTENWGRPAEEVNALIGLLCDCTLQETPALLKQDVRILFIGDIDGMTDEVKASMAQSELVTRDCRTLTLVIAVNYSARWEITRMAQKMAAQAVAGTLEPEEITVETVSLNLTTAGLPDPDLLIRTSGELRLSNFLLWQLAYSELYFTPVYWPDFDEAEFEKAVREYQKRERRYGVLTK